MHCRHCSYSQQGRADSRYYRVCSRRCQHLPGPRSSQLLSRPCRTSCWRPVYNRLRRPQARHLLKSSCGRRGTSCRTQRRQASTSHWSSQTGQRCRQNSTDLVSNNKRCECVMNHIGVKKEDENAPIERTGNLPAAQVMHLLLLR